MIEQKWRVRLGAVAELDFANILKGTTENFGARQSRIYRDTLVRAIGELANGPDVAGSKARDEIMSGLRTLHVARHGRRGRHFLLYRIVKGRIIEIGRILHDQMNGQGRRMTAPRSSREKRGADAQRLAQIRPSKCALA